MKKNKWVSDMIERWQNDARYRRQVVINIVVIVCICVIACIVFWWIKKDNARKELLLNHNSIEVDGKTYIQKDDVISILVLGIDLRGTIENEKKEIGYNGQSDMMCVVSYDKTTRQAYIVTIPRETMTTIDLREKQDPAFPTKEAQICLQYANAKSSQVGAELSRKCVEDLLGIPIDYYVALSMGGIQALVDDIGGVSITMSEDYDVPDYNEVPGEEVWVKYRKGETVTMDGARAYEFVHYRDTEHNSTNLIRMKRQRDFFDAFISSAKKKVKKDPKIILSIVSDLKDYMTTDIEPKEYVTLGQYAINAEIPKDSVMRIPGEEMHVGEYDQYHVDKEQLVQMILPIYFEELK